MNTFATASIGILLCFLVYIFILIYLGQSSRRWASTAGKLLELKVVDARFLSVKLKYEYEVNCKKYIGRRISFMNPIYESRTAIESDFGHVKQGEFKVYYNHKFPKVSTLTTGFKGWSTAIFIIFLFLIGICGIAVSSIKSASRVHQIQMNDQHGGGSSLR